MAGPIAQLGEPGFSRNMFRAGERQNQGKILAGFLSEAGLRSEKRKAARPCRRYCKWRIGFC